jgi:threonine dehydrogenase-like Zn-dependent dehydrogenase
MAAAVGSGVHPRTMQAAVIAGPRRLRVEQVARPEPGARQVRVRVEGCGVCGSNLPTWEGREWFSYPLAPGAPGHEGWGVVDALGEGVTRLREGQRIAFLSSSAFAQYDAVAEDAAVVLPPALDGQPFPGEPLGCAMNVLRRSDIQRGHTVAIVGIGFLGALLTRLATDAGARVIAITRRPWALALARQLGAAELVPMDEPGRVLERVKALTGGALCERVIEVVGAQGPLDLATELTRERGRLIIAGYHQDGPRSVNLWLWNWRGLDVINAHERDPRVYLEGIQLAVDAVVGGRLDPTPLYTHRYALAQASEAFEAMRARPDGFLKALVTP